MVAKRGVTMDTLDFVSSGVTLCMHLECAHWQVPLPLASGMATQRRDNKQYALTQGGPMKRTISIALALSTVLASAVFASSALAAGPAGGYVGALAGSAHVTC